MSIKEDIEKVQKKVNAIEEQSFAMEILKDYKKANKRLYIILIVVLCMWFATIGYLVYVLNDTGTIETTRVEQSDAGSNNYIGNDGEIINGNTKDNKDNN